MEASLVREIITIDEDKCDGCGVCVPNCPEGALQIIDGKARLVGELLCDGLGACVGECPQEAMTVERREAEPYDEEKVMANIVDKGVNTTMAHLAHLQHAGASEYLAEALQYIESNEFAGRSEVLGRLSELQKPAAHGHAAGNTSGVRVQVARADTGPKVHHACPGSREMAFGPGGGGSSGGATPGGASSPGAVAPAGNGAAAAGASTDGGSQQSALSHWPVQLHLINPESPHFHGCDMLLAADCTAYCLGGFHSQLLSGRKLTIACPKLDQGAEIYVEKLTALIDRSKINTLTVAIMEVPCCGGLVQIARLAASQAQRKVPIKQIVVSVTGEIIEEEWI